MLRFVKTVESKLGNYSETHEVNSKEEFEKLYNDCKEEADFHKKYTRPYPTIVLTGLDGEEPYCKQFL